MILGIIALLIFPLVSADVIFPTVTNVYFEQGGQEYNGKIDFTVKGYGYSIGMPGSPGFDPDKESGTYTPEVVFSFTATYSNYGDKIYKDYYRNYANIDYYELEGETSDGRIFIIRNIESIPTSCSEGDNYDIMINSKYYRETEEYNQCIYDIENYVPTYGRAEDEPAGATRPENNGNIWTKQEDGWWKSPEYPELSWGDYPIDEQKGGVSYVSRGRAYDGCDQYLEEIPELEIEKDDRGYTIERTCGLKFNLDNAEWDYALPQSKSFWSKISCFFKRLFGGSC